MHKILLKVIHKHPFESSSVSMNKFDSIGKGGPAETEGTFPYSVPRAMVLSTIPTPTVFGVEGVVAIHDCGIIWKPEERPLNTHAS